MNLPLLYQNRLQTDIVLDSSSSMAAIAAWHRLHNFNIPFENLDIIAGIYHPLSADNWIPRILHNNRGGYCFELNGLFAHLLTTIGFKPVLHNARILFGSNAVFARGHQLMTLQLEQQTWLLDVGYRYGIINPIPLVHNIEITQYSEVFRLTQLDSGEWLLQKKIAGDWVNLYSFYTTPCEQVDFSPMHYSNAHNSDSIFTQHRIVTRKTPEGTLSLIDNILIRYESDRKTSSPVQSEQDYQETLEAHFGIVLSLEDAGYLFNSNPANRNQPYSFALQHN